MKYAFLFLILLLSANCGDKQVQTQAVGDIISCFKLARQSSNYNGANSYPADKAFDCRNQPTHGANFSQTGLEQFPWIEVDLQGVYQINQIDVINRQDNAIAKGRLKKFRIFVTDTPLTSLPATGEVAAYNRISPALDSIKFPVNAQGRYLRLWMENTAAANYLSLSEIRIWGQTPSEPPVVTVCDTVIYQVPVMRDSMVITCDTL